MRGKIKEKANNNRTKNDLKWLKNEPVVQFLTTLYFTYSNNEKIF